MKANLKSTAAALGLLALGMAPAFAADAVMEEPPAPAAPMEQPPLNTWSGPYAGVTLGYGFSGQTDVGDPALEIDTDGFLAHGFAGYQMESNGFVYGLEADLGYGGYKGDNAGIEFEGRSRWFAPRPPRRCRNPGCPAVRHRRWCAAEQQDHRHRHRQQ